MKFHEMLANARPRSMSQADAAKAVGVSRNTVSAWERGLLTLDVRQFVTLCDAYGTAAEDRAKMLSQAAAEGVANG